MINQSIYLPWKGFFDMIQKADHYIIYDSSQYVEKHFRNRQYIKSEKGLQRLTVPVFKRHSKQNIIDKKVADETWGKKHWNAIIRNYAKTRYISEFKSVFKPFFLDNSETNLSKINEAFIRMTCEVLNIKTPISRDSDYTFGGDSNQRLIGFCKKLKATKYFATRKAESYINKDLFQKNNISIEWFDYPEYPVYSQPYPPFRHDVSIIDLLCCKGFEGTIAYL